MDTVAPGSFVETHRPGLLWRNAATGQNLLWHTNLGVPVQTTPLPIMTAPNVELATTGDFDGDGTSELLWRDRSTGLNYLWNLSADGLSVAEREESSSEENLNAYPVGFGDLNGDHRDDLIWRYGDLGQNQIWYMNGSLVTGSAGLESNLNLNDELVGSGDFDGDGVAELLWRDRTTGATTLWFLDGLQRNRTVSLPSRADLAWKIEGTQDFNQDGKQDILWRYYGETTGPETIGPETIGPETIGPVQKGQTEIWLMDGAEQIGTQTLLTISDLNWEPTPVSLPKLADVPAPEPPTSEPPTSEPPTTDPPTTDPPVTDPPVTDPSPTTDPFTVLAPNGGESLQAGETYTIEWESNLPSTASVLINLYQGEQNVAVIKGITANDGSEAWTVPSQLALGNDYRIRVKQFAAAPEDFSDTSFSIVPKPDIDIQIFDPNNAFTTQQWSAFNTAANQWEQLITSDKDSTGIFRVSVTQSSRGPRILASAYIDNQRDDRTNIAADDVDINGVDYDNKVEWNLDLIEQLTPNQWFTTMVHELGHGLGLPHENDPESLMYFEERENQILTEATLSGLERLGYRIDRTVVAQINAQLASTA